jgi:hypothetical protein
MQMNTFQTARSNQVMEAGRCYLKDLSVHFYPYYRFVFVQQNSLWCKSQLLMSAALLLQRKPVSAAAIPPICQCGWRLIILVCARECLLTWACFGGACELTVPSSKSNLFNASCCCSKQSFNELSLLSEDLAREASRNATLHVKTAAAYGQVGNES